MKTKTVQSIQPTYAKSLSGMIGKHQRGLFHDCKENPNGVLLFCKADTFAPLTSYLSSKGFRYRSIHSVDGTIRILVHERVV